VDPVVSVCMTTYNQAPYISEAIESVLCQETSFPFELVIGEDCSTDKTLEICRQYQTRYPEVIKLHPRHPNLGFAKNLALTWAECKGQYIAILEGDDLWCSPSKLQEQVDFLQANPDYSMCYTKTNIKSEEPNRHDQWPYRQTRKNTLTTSDILRHNLIANCSVMYRRAFPQLPEWTLSLPYFDICLHSLHSLNGPVGRIPKIMATYRLHGSSSFESKSYLERMRLSSVVYAELANHLPSPYCHQATETLLMMYLGLRRWRDSLQAFLRLPPKYQLTWPAIPAEQLYHMCRVR
jgi:glycosyltransferase involved in cell wall biosynthesis